MSHYFNTFELTRGLLVAILSSAFIYLEHWGVSTPVLTSILGLLALYILLESSAKVWFFSGAFIGLFWFWWMVLSFKHYEMLWAMPIGLLVITLGYGIILWSIAKIAEKLSSILPAQYNPLCILLKALGLLTLSYIHPFNFDWLKPELMFVQSYIGIAKWQFGLVLLSISLSLWKKQLLYLFLILFAYEPTGSILTKIPDNIALVSTQTNVQDKWDESQHEAQFAAILQTIDHAIDGNKTLIILPESVFPVFINRSQDLMAKLQEKAKKISIVTGGLYWDGERARNSSYIFTNNKITVANKVLLVPFGESNPLPEFLSKWVNKVFFDDAIDYKASTKVIDYVIDGLSYRNAICFEATSEALYAKGKDAKRPKQMIVLSNNAWFTPSIEPTLQKLLLTYYSKKYRTTIYHSVNMSESYVLGF